jgi:hypothetical protein
MGLNGGWALEDIVFQTLDYMYHMRTSYSGITFASVEAYPQVPRSTIQTYITRLHQEAPNWGISPPRYFELDHDRNRSGWTWADVTGLRNHARSLGWLFGYIFGSPVKPGFTWHQWALNSGDAMKTFGITVDHYTFESWEASDPCCVVPETAPGSGGFFMGTVREFRSSGYFPR